MSELRASDAAERLVHEMRSSGDWTSLRTLPADVLRDALTIAGEFDPELLIEVTIAAVTASEAAGSGAVLRLVR